MRRFGVIGDIWRGSWWNVWRLSEAFGVDLGRFAPWVFGQMLGSKGRRVNDEE